MKKNFGLIIAVIAVAIVLSTGSISNSVSSSSVQSDQAESSGVLRGYTMTGDITSGWGTTGGDLWYDVLKETEQSTEGGYYDAATPPVYGVIKRPPSTTVKPNPVNPTNHNWIEVDYILVTGQNGDRGLFAVGELDPRFGNGMVNLTFNKNKKAYDLSGLGRGIKKVTAIEIVHAFTNIKGVANDVHPYSPSIVVSGAGITPRTYYLADLQAMPQVTFDASASTTNTKGIWTGPTLLSVLKDAGVNTKNMDGYIIVQSTDGYATLLSMYEATHLTGPQYAMLAISGGTINDGSAKDSGLTRFVLPKDRQAGRWVSNSAQIIVSQLEH